MKKKKKFVVPGVLQVCEVLLERDLLGESQQFMPNSTVETTGHHIEDTGTTYNTDWNNSGTWLD